MKHKTSAPELKYLEIKDLGLCDYSQTWEAMKSFTQERDGTTRDQLWLVQHPSVFTLGLNGKSQHIIVAGDTPIVQCDRGGQVTYHAPGQIVCYILIELQRYQLGVKQLVHYMEEAVIKLLADYDIHGQRKSGAPGIYVDGAKIAALGLRIRRGCSYHGLSLNVDMDMEPFSRINPCGYEGLESCQLNDFVESVDMETVGQQLLQQIQAQLTGLR